MCVAVPPEASVGAGKLMEACHEWQVGGQAKFRGRLGEGREGERVDLSRTIRFRSYSLFPRLPHLLSFLRYTPAK